MSDSAPRVPQLANPIAVDLRSLAAFRVATAVCVLVELLTLLPDVGALYSDSGVLPRAELLAWFGDSYERPISLALMAGSAESQVLIFACTALAALAMLAGYHTRFATAACWLLLVSIHLRNPFVVFGAGVLLHLLLFWGCFLPLGDRFSIDHARGGGEIKQSHVSLPGVALQVQICLVFVIAGLAKVLNPIWAEGQGVLYALDDEILMTGAGSLLSTFPALCALLSYAVMALELIGPALLFIPWYSGPIRVAVLAAMSCMLLGFSLGLRVGLFPYAGMAALAIFIPGWFWDRVAVRWQSSRGKAVLTRCRESVLRHLGPAQASGWFRVRHPLLMGARDVFVLLALAYVIVWNIGLWRDASYVAPEPLKWVGDTFRLRQRWGMFTRLPSTGWFTIPGKLRDGTEVDLFQAGGPLPSYEGALRSQPSERPDLVSASFRSVPWLIFFLSTRDAPDGFDGQLQSYGRYLCREWNRREVGERQLLGFELIYMSRPVEPVSRERPPGEYRRTVLWTHDCFG